MKAIKESGTGRNQTYAFDFVPSVINSGFLIVPEWSTDHPYQEHILNDLKDALEWKTICYFRGVGFCLRGDIPFTSLF